MASDFLFPADSSRQRGGEGILPSQEIRDLIANGKIILPIENTDDQVQPSSIDLRLSNEAYRVRASFLPGKTSTLLTKAKANGMVHEKFDISGLTLLEPGVIYIVPLMERLALPQDVYGIANPKSSTGRLDIFTRLITEHGDEFDRVGRGYNGNLYIEIISQTFPILVQAGMKLNQLRFGRGKERPAGDGNLRELDQGNGLVDPDDDTVQASIDRGLRITVDLQGNGSGIVAYKAKKFAPPIALDKIGYYDIAEYWTPIHTNSKQAFVLEPGEFYILASKQRVRVPPDRAAEMLPYDLATQEFRVHYAGFFDPGFGFGLHGEIPGTRAVLEVRATQIPILLEDDQFVGRLNYYKMAETPDKVYGSSIGSSYQQQGLTLSKQFKRDEQYISGSAVRIMSEDESLEGKGRVRLEQSRNVEGVDDDDEDSGPNLSFAESSGERWVSARSR